MYLSIYRYIWYGYISSLLRNGQCDEYLNNAECCFDFGECEGTTALPDIPQLSTTIDEQMFEVCLGCGYAQSLIGDGVCQDKLNDPECCYDAGDCFNRGDSGKKKPTLVLFTFDVVCTSQFSMFLFYFSKFHCASINHAKIRLFSRCSIRHCISDLGIKVQRVCQAPF